jgi:membrane protease YdiL (CAAX protease family)
MNKRNNIFLILSPIALLLLTKLGIYFTQEICSKSVSWIIAFTFYYFFIFLIWFIAEKKFKISFKDLFKHKFKPLPKIKLLILGILLPSLLPIGVFIQHADQVNFIFFIYILIFSIINAPIEEIFWRGLLSNLPFKKWGVIIYTSALFGFSHYFLWDYWFEKPMIVIPTVISTTIMGILWMWFLKTDGRIKYPILSHIVVDILNLSVPIFSGTIIFNF